MQKVRLQLYMRISNIVQIITILALVISCISAEGETTPSCPAVFIPCQPKQPQNPQRATILTYYIQSDLEQADDFIEMSLTIKQKDTSLKKAIDKLTRKVESINTLFQDYCRKNKGEGCEQRVEVDKYVVQPSYQVVRRQPIFNGFVVTHSVTITVLETTNIGELVDTLLGLGIYQIEQLQWKPHVQVDSTQLAIDTGITKGKELCRHINRKMGAILTITEVFFEDDEDDNQDNDNDGTADQDEEDQQQPSKLQFKIQCIDQVEKAAPVKPKKTEEEKAKKKEKKK